MMGLNPHSGQTLNGHRVLRDQSACDILRARSNGLAKQMIAPIGSDFMLLALSRGALIDCQLGFKGAPSV